jgi:tetratricopeptide (TPR) repeat protein
MKITKISLPFLYVLITLITTLKVEAQDKSAIKDSVAVNDTSFFFLKGMENFNNKDLVKAKECFKSLLAENPRSDAAYYYLSQIALIEEDQMAGESYLKEAIKLDSSNFWYKSTLAKIYAASKRNDDAIKIYEDLINKFPKKTEIYYNLANLYLNAEYLDKAEATLKKIGTIFGKNEAVGLAMFNIFRIKNDWEGAIKYLVTFDEGLDSPKIETLIGDLYADRFKDSLAMSYYDKALKNEPNNPGAVYGQAEVYRNKGDYTQYFNKLTPLFGNASIPVIMKTEYLKQMMQSQRFVQTYQKQIDTLVDNIVASTPPDSTTYYTCAAYFSKSGRPDRCIELLKKNHNLYPNSKFPAFEYLSYIYTTEDWNLLGKESIDIAKQFPEELYPLQVNAISKIQSKAYAEGIVVLEKVRELAIKMNDTTALLNAYSLLGDTYHELGNESKTFQFYKKALSIDPNNLPVLNNFAYYLSMKKQNLKRAYAMSSITVAKEPDNPTYLDTFGWILYLMNRPVEAKANFKHAMLYGGKENAVILDHYAEVLFKLKEYDLAFIYWEQANNIDRNLKLDLKIKERKEQIVKK